MPAKLVFGLIGRIGSGKTVIANHLVEEYAAQYFRFSDVLKDILARVHKPNTRENLQNLGLSLRKTFGEGILAETLKDDILESKSRVIVVDGVRYEDELRMVKGVGGRIIYVTSPDRLRYERAVKRGTRGEAEISFDQFKVSEQKETERRIDVLGEKADYKIENTGTIEDLKANVDSIVKNFRG